MSPRRVLMPLLLLAAAAAPAAGFLGEGAGGAGLLLPLLVFAGAAAQGLPPRLRLRGEFLRLRGRVAVAVRVGLALGVLLGFAAGSRHAPFLAALLPAALRGLRRPFRAREMRTLRDAVVVAVAHLAFEGSGAALLSAAAVVLLTAALLPVLHAERAARAGDGERHVEVPRAGKEALRTAAWAVPATALLAALLFVALPRTSDRAAEEPSSLARRGRGEGGGGGGPGSPTSIPARRVTLGDIGRLQRDLRPILEVTVLRAGRPAAAEEYGPLLRSGALEGFDGLDWTSSDRRFVHLLDGRDGKEDGWIALPRRRPPSPPAGESLEQRVTHLAGGSDALFCLGIPVAVGGAGAARGVFAFGRGELRSAREIAEGEEVHLRSVVAGGAYPPLDDEVLNATRRIALLALPDGHERTAAMARLALGGAPPGSGTLRALEAWLAARCSYSLDLPRELEGPPVEGFLFTSRRGHCELFASSAAVMLRAVGIPARLAIGFRGGVYDPVARHYTFRGADAHAWVEAWFEDRGWVTFDPTPAPGAGGGGEEAWEEGAAPEGREEGWSRRVLLFDGAAQRRLLLAVARGVGRGLHRALFRDGGGVRWDGVVAALLAAALLAGALLWRRRTVPPGDPGRAVRLPPPPPPPESYALLLERLAGAGVPRLPTETAREHGERALGLGFLPAEALRRVVAAFEGERWGGRVPAAQERGALRELAASVGRPEGGSETPA